MTASDNAMTSSRPYLIRALYDWIVDNGLTPYLLVNAERSNVQVPEEHVHEGRIVLNINPMAVRNMQLGNELIEFSARFSGVGHQVRVPPPAVLAIYAKENGQGMAFGDDDDNSEPPSPTAPTTPEKSGSKRPHLKVVK